jgi:outer membrane lipoprotein-sorting protein
MKSHLLIGIAFFTILLACKNDTNKTESSILSKEVPENVLTSKTFVIKYKTEVKYKDASNVSSTTQWIDTGNDRVAIETESENNLKGKKQKSKNLTIIKGNEAWVIDLTTKTGNYGKDSKLTNKSQAEVVHAKDDATFRKKVEESGGKILGSETFLDKKCTVVELSDSSGKSEMKTKIWYYQGIPLKMSNAYYRTEAIDIRENVEIPDSKFEVPEGIKIGEMPK